MGCPLWVTDLLCNFGCVTLLGKQGVGWGGEFKNDCCGPNLHEVLCRWALVPLLLAFMLH